MSEPSYIGKSVIDLPTPALVIDKNVLERNCQKMFNLAKEMNIKLRAQTKTHKTIEGAILQTGGTKRSLVVSTLIEAEFFASAGFDDILYGYPLMEHHMERNYKLCEQLDEYHLLITNQESASFLATVDPPSGKKWSTFIKVDCGNARSGIPHTDVLRLIQVGKKLIEHKDKIVLQGIYVHCGDSYSATSIEGVEKVRDETIETLCILAKKLTESGVEIKEWGLGSTPSCSHVGEKMKLLTEIHPGNYIFYDLQNEMLGSCKRSDIACTVIARVIGHYPHRNQLLIDAGFLGLSEQGFDYLGGSFAYVKDFPELAVVKMTQEIGFVEPKVKSQPLNYEKIPVGTVLFLYQYHHCDTAAKHPVYYVEENGKVVDEWKPTRGW